MPASHDEREAVELLYRPRVPARPVALRVELEWLCRLTLRRNYTYSVHRHASHVVLVPERGTYRGRINGQAVVARTGQAVLVQPSDVHQDVLVAGQCYWGVGLRVRWHDGTDAGLLADEQPAGMRVATVGLDDLLGLLGDELGRGDAIAASRQDSLSEELLWRVVRCLPLPALSPRLRGEEERDRFVSAIEAVFRQHADGGLSVPLLSQKVGQGVTALTTHCRRFLGTSPARAFTRWRVEQARLLLRDTGLPVTAVAERLGFANPYHFARVVRRHAGVPPSRLRWKR